VSDFRASLGRAGGAGGGAGAGGAGAGPRLVLERPSLRTAELARVAAEAQLRRVRGRARGARLLGVGRAEVALGDAVALEDVSAAADGSYQVRAVRHRLNRRGGFTTAVEIEEAP
jgi:phage protein D